MLKWKGSVFLLFKHKLIVTMNIQSICNTQNGAKTDPKSSLVKRSIQLSIAAVTEFSTKAKNQ